MDNKTYYASSCEEVLSALETDANTGLFASTASKRLLENGKNELISKKKRPIIFKFFDQLKDFMVIVLLAAAALSFVLAIIENNRTGHGDFFEPILIIAIIMINAILGVFQEEKAQKAIDSIKKMSSPHAKVIRDSVDLVIDVAEVVVGDIIVLDAGDYVSADCRLIEAINLKIEESSLTGEALPVEKTTATLENKDIALGDQVNLAFMSTVVTYGRGKGVVTRTGMNSEIGHIATMLETSSEETTPLQKNIAQLGKILAIIALIVVVLIMAINLLTALVNNSPGGISVDTWTDAILNSVALAVAAIPEGLPAIITIVLALGMQSLVRKKAIVRTLPAVETLGSTSIICSDKTGTLTQNIMSIEKVYLDNQLLEVGTHKESNTLSKLALFGLLCNDTKIRFENNNYIKIGDPTEIAFIDLALKILPNVDIKNKLKRIAELPFDSERKLMTTVHDIDGTRYAVIKGAPDVIFNRANSIYQDNQIVPTNDFKIYEEHNAKMAKEAMRVLGVAFKILDNTCETFDQETLENDITVLGLVGMIDPARVEVADAIILCKKAGITTIMITGDHKLTATAIASKLGILSNDDLSITGKELDNMTDEEFFNKYQNIKVYARVSPENKVRIVEAWKRSGLVVAMTGDGVNDAPSIKRSDIGIAMGITGTEVAKGAADMILTDDNFATIVEAVSEGRTIFANIKKAIHFLLSCNIGEIITILVGTILTPLIFLNDTIASVTILTATQLLWVNLVTDSLMGISLGMEQKEKNVMDFPPRDTRKSVFAGGLGKRIAFHGIILGMLSVIAYLSGYYLALTNHPLDYVAAHAEAQVMTFMVLALSQLFHAFNVRSETTSIFRMKPNKFLIASFAISAILQVSVIFIPGIQNAFVGAGHSGLALPNGIEWLVIVGLSIFPIILVEMIKLIKRLKTK